MGEGLVESKDGNMGRNKPCSCVGRCHHKIKLEMLEQARPPPQQVDNPKPC